MILIRKVAEPHGWLGNMAPFPVVFQDKSFRTSEALFQSMRFEDQEIIDSIREQKSPMAAKMIAKKHKDKMVVTPMSDLDLDNMRSVLSLKLTQHENLLQLLQNTSDQEIIEDCSKRPRGSGLFWGAAFQNNQWVGQNWLGRLWMDLRTKNES